MNNQNPYQALGVGIAPMLGRRGVREKIMRHLSNPVPGHLTIVGPRFIGKTVLLKALADQVSEDGNLFAACVFWDVLHSPIESDADFYRELAIKTAKALKPVDGLLSEELSKPEGRNYGALRDVFEYLQAESRRVLLIWDGMDHVLSAAQVTRNLWDSLRSLAELPSVRIITGSRKFLRELCVNPESRTSDFWRIFHDPIKLGAFTDEDWDDFLAPFAMRKVNLSKGARTEIVNWTGGAPVLAAALCAKLWTNLPSETAISNTFINEIAISYFARDETLLPALWEDCDLDERSDLADIANEGPLRINDVPQNRAQALQQRGYVRVEDTRLNISCRAMKNYACQHGGDATALRRLFGSTKEYEHNLVSLLELRLGQLNLPAGDLKNQLNVAIQNVASSPATSIRQVRGLVDDIFEMIWDAELPDRRIPVEWSDAWNENGWNGLRGAIPAEGGARCRLLGLLTDNRKAGSTRMSRQSYTLQNFLQSVGDFGQHIGAENVLSSYAAIACLAVIQLLGQLGSEFSSAEN